MGTDAKAVARIGRWRRQDGADPRRARTASSGGSFGQRAALRLLRLMPPLVFHHIRKRFVIGDVMLRMIDRVVPAQGVLVRRVRAGPVRGMVLEMDPRSQDMAIGRYETDVQVLIQEHVQDADVVFDVGAHLGYFSLVMAAGAMRGARIVSFEPDPWLMEGLRRNLRRNGHMTHARVIPVRSALGPQSGRSGFARGWRSTRGRLTDDPGDVDVPVLTLDDAAGRFGEPGFVKIDVEGAEIDVLRGGTKTLGEIRPTLVIEAHAPSLEKRCIDLLAGFHYRCDSFMPSDRRESYVVARPSG